MLHKILTSSLIALLTLAVPAFGAQASAGQAAAAKSAPATKPATLVNLNSASQDDLEALPGVGPATAKKIIAGRPYSTVADLAKAGIPKNTIDKITPMVTAGAASAPALKPAAGTPAAASTASPASATSSNTTKPTSAPGAAAATAQQPPVKGMVWVNLDTKVFHREGDRYYGKTKNGKFMTEADAIKAGYQAAKTGGKKPS